MINRIEISNIKGFGEITLEGLGHINLITGKNNVGKTSLLEAIALGSGSLNTSEIAKAFRGDSPLAHWSFLKWLLPAEWSANTSSPDLASVALKFTKDKTTKSSRIDPNLLDYYLQASEPDSFLASLTKGPIQDKKFITFTDPAEPTSTQAAIAPTSARSQSLIDSFSKATNSIEDELKLLQLVRHIDPRVERLRLGSVQEKIEIKIDLGLGESMPASQVGEGMNRFIGIVSTLIGEKPDILLIDEIENGLHYSCYDKIWEGLIEASKSLGVQIFATTHSREMFESASKAAVFNDPKNEVDIRIIQCMRLRSGIDARVLDEDHIRAAVESEIPVR